MFDECSEVTDTIPVRAWLTYYVIAFYLNLIAMAVFLAIASCRKFKTMREREGFAGTRRKNMDFLSYC